MTASAGTRSISAWAIAAGEQSRTISRLASFAVFIADLPDEDSCAISCACAPWRVNAPGGYLSADPRSSTMPRFALPVFYVACSLALIQATSFAQEVRLVDSPPRDQRSPLYTSNREPLAPSPFIKLPIGSIE